MSQPIRRENGDVMETKTRLDDIMGGIKVLNAVIFLIPSPAVEEATLLNSKTMSHGIGEAGKTPYSHTTSDLMGPMTCQITVMNLTTRCE